MSTNALVQEVVGEGQTLPTTTIDQIGTATQRLNDIAEEMAKAKTEDTARFDALKEEQKAQAETLETLKQKHDAEKRDADANRAFEMAAEAKAALEHIRKPSMAHRIGSGPSIPNNDTERGAFLKALMDSSSVRNFDPEARAEAKAWLESWGRRSDGDGDAMTYDAASKSTLGSTAATGGWIIPNYPVDDLIKPSSYTTPILQLATVVRGLNVGGVDIPFRTTAPTASVVIPWGDQKTLTDLTYNGYTATMYTLASIYNIGQQFARKSMGAAEQDVMQELQQGLSRGVSTYIYQGTGSSQPFGLNAALVTSPPFSPTTTTAHTADADTIGGSTPRAIAVAAGALESRNRTVEAVLMSSTGYWTAVGTEGSANSGFFFAPAMGGPTAQNAKGQLSVWGIPIYREPTYLTGADDMIIGEFSALKIYFGDGPRFDSSDIADDRWDKNLVGFRGELEMAFDARPAVYAGAIQFVADITE